MNLDQDDNFRCQEVLGKLGIFGGQITLFIFIGSIEKLKEAMTTSGNHKLDLQVTVTEETWECDDGWTIVR